MKLVTANVDLMQVSVIINKDGMRINADVNAMNWLTKDLLGILEIVNVNLINHMMLKNIYIMKM